MSDAALVVLEASSPVSQAVPIFLGASITVAGTILAVFLTYLFHRRMWSKRAALDFVLSYEIHDRAWVESRNNAVLYLIGLSPQQRAQVAAAWVAGAMTAPDLAGMTHVFNWLNHMEVVAVGISNKSLHRDAYLRWLGPTELKKLWGTAEPMVKALRKASGDKTLYTELADFVKSL